MISKHTFEGGMNMDLDESRLAPNQYRYALNMRNGNSEKGAVGTITNAEGNVRISVTLPSGANKVIGCLDDEANDRVIYIVYNNNGNNRILAYDYKNDVVNTIVADSGNILNLSVDYLINGIDVIAGDGASYLLFTDNYGDPKNINIDQGIRTYDTIQSNGVDYDYRRLLGDFDTVSPISVKEGYVYYRDIEVTDEDGNTATQRIFYRAKAFTTQDPTSTITSYQPQSDWEICPAGYVYGALEEENFVAIVQPPRNTPEAVYTTSSNDYNYLYGSLYQFKARYIAADGRQSPWSPVTTFVDPQYIPDSILDLTEYNNINKFNNQIDVFVDTPDSTKIKTVEFAIRRALNDTAPSDWQVAGKVDVVNDIQSRSYSDSSKIKFSFDGSTAPLPLDTDTATQLMSWIPTKAQAQAITSRNRVLYANFTEGLPYNPDGVYGINQNPPKVEFFERDNPYSSVTQLSVYKYNGSTISGATITEESFFDPPIRSASGLAFRFPATVVVGRQYTINVSVEYDTGGVDEPAVGLGTSVQLRPTTTTTSTLLDRFVAQFTNNKSNYLISYAGQEFNKYLLTAVSASSGGSAYLIVRPTAAATVGGVTITPQIRKVPSARVGTTVGAIQSFKRGTRQQFGIAYSDNYGRLSTVFEHPQFTATNRWWRDSSVSGATSAIAGNTYADIGQRYAQLTLAHDAPSWATRYHIVKTISNGILNSVSFPLSRVTRLPNTSDGSTNPIDDKYFFRGYLKKTYTTAFSGITVTSATSLADTELIYISLAALQGSTVGYSELNETPIVYDYTEGDRLRLCYFLTSANGIPTATSNYFESEADAEILFYSSELNAIAIRPNDLPDELVGTNGIFEKTNEAGNGGAGNQTAIRGLLCEIYSPQKERFPEFYYEVYTGSISAETATSRYYHVGNVQTQTSAQSAIVELTNGDCFLKPRTYAWRANTSDVAATASATTLNYFVEEFNYYDKVASRTWGAGRPNRSIRTTSLSEDITGFNGEVKRPTTIRYSEPFLPEQGYNGLGTMKDIDFKDANGAMKSIQHLHSEGSRVIILHENAVGFAESDRAVITTLDGNNMTIGANTPLSDVVYYSDRAGIGKNPTSFAFNNNRKYFVDIDQGQVCRLSQDGITPISQKGMDKYFKDVFRNMINSPQDDYAFGAYDKRTDEYTLTLKWTVEISGASQTDVLTEDSGATVEFTVGDTSGYDTFVGDFIRLYFPEYEIGGTYYDSFDQEVEVTAISSTVITVAIPTASQSLVNAVVMGGTAGDQTIYIYPKNSRTLTFSERLNAWTSFHSFNAENLSSAGIDFVSFRGGDLYIHNDYDNPMRYYGTDYNAYIDIVENSAPDQIKVPKTTAIKVTTENAEVVETDFLVPVASADTTGAQQAVNGGVVDSRGKISTCTTPTYKEGQIYFDYMRTGTGTSYSGYIEGDKVRGYWFKTRYKINSGIAKIYKIISVTFDIIPSNYTR